LITIEGRAVNIVEHYPTMTRTASIGIRVDPTVKAAAEKAAADDHRTVASLIEKLLVEHLVKGGYLKR
jgi:hypothetical protein